MEITKKCACGAIPTNLTIVKIGDTHYNAYGNCCGRWGFLFYSTALERDSLMKDAIKNWNEDSKVT